MTTVIQNQAFSRTFTFRFFKKFQMSGNAAGVCVSVQASRRLPLRVSQLKVMCNHGEN